MFKQVSLAVLFVSMSFKAMACPYFEEAARRSSMSIQKNIKSISLGREDATEENFNRIIDDITGLYKEPLSQYSGILQIKKDWKSETNNAYAMSFLGYWKLMFYGSLFRDPLMTDDAFAMVVCHEIGHLLGGAPYYNGPGRASVEGQADFWATSVCFRKYMTIAPGRAPFKLHNKVKSNCDLQYHTVQDREICYRTGQASLETAEFLYSNSEQDWPSLESKPLPKIGYTNQGHPQSQCRLETFLAGSLCIYDESDEARVNRIHKSDLVTSSLCLNERKEMVEKRPGCWFHPDNNAFSIMRIYTKKGDRKFRVTYRPHFSGEYTISLKSTSDKVEMLNSAIVHKFKQSEKAKNLDFFYRFSESEADLNADYILAIEKDGSKIFNEKIKGWPMQFETEK